MTYQESFALALKLKDFVCLYDEKAWIYFVFTSETEFDLQIFNERPSDEINDRIVKGAYAQKLPSAGTLFCKHDNTVTFDYRDQNLIVVYDLKTGDMLEFDGEENTPIDMDKVRKSFKQLIAKLK